MTSPSRAMLVGAVIGALAAGVAAAQPGRERPADRQAERAPAPERLRAFLEQRLEATRENEAALAALLERLDSGESPDAVAEDAREAVRAMLEPLREWGGGPPGDRAAGGPPADAPEMTTEQLFDLLGEVDEPMRDRIRRLAQENPERARAILRDAAPRLRELAQLKRDDPEAFRLRLAMMQAGRDAFRAAMGYARAQREGAGAEELARRRDEVAGAMRQRIDYEQQMKAREIDRLAKRVEQLRAELAQAGENADEIVERETQRAIEGASRPRGERRRDGDPARLPPPDQR
jgi:cell division protein FtsB